jgi:hypothetical protein
MRDGRGRELTLSESPRSGRCMVSSWSLNLFRYGHCTENNISECVYHVCNIIERGTFEIGRSINAIWRDANLMEDFDSVVYCTYLLRCPWTSDSLIGPEFNTTSVKDSTHLQDCYAAGVGVPGFLLQCQCVFGEQAGQPRRQLAGQVVDLVRVLPAPKLVLKRFILQDLDSV